MGPIMDPKEYEKLTMAEALSGRLLLCKRTSETWVLSALYDSTESLTDVREVLPLVFRLMCSASWDWPGFLGVSNSCSYSSGTSCAMTVDL